MSCIDKARLRLSPCSRRLLLEAKRIETEYDSTKENCDQAREMSQYVLDTLGREESTQTQEISLRLAQEIGMINQKAYELINQTIKKMSTICGMSLEDMDIDHGTPGASRGKREVSVLQYPGWVIDAERVARSCSLAVSK